MMQEIPLEQWIPFLAAFTREHRGAHARLEIIRAGDELLYQVETENQQFEGISPDIKGRERTVWISFSSKMGANLTHGVHHATAVHILPATETAGTVFEVESDDGTKTLLELTRAGEFTLSA